MKRIKVILSALAMIVAMPMLAAEAYHAGMYANCSDCHTMHASVRDNQGAGVNVLGTAVSAVPTASGGTDLNEWLPVQGTARHNLLKNTKTDLCTACHDGKSFAPDVVDADTAGMGTSVRSGGFLNGIGGHKLGSKIIPPGFSPVAIGAVVGTDSKVYDPTVGLECTSCHSAHGSVTVYRQLAPYSWGTQNGGPNIRANVQPLRALAVSPTLALDGTVDVNIGVANTWTPGPNKGYYNAANITYIKATTVKIGETSTNNRYDTFCGACHGQFHGGATGQGATASTLDTNGNVFDNAAKLFVRHPTAGVSMGTSKAATYNSGTGTWQKAPMYRAAQTTDPNDNDTPGCVSCHKAHGNGNPFGLLYIGAGALTEGGSATGTYVSLCQQCHNMSGL